MFPPTKIYDLLLPAFHGILLKLSNPERDEERTSQVTHIAQQN